MRSLATALSLALVLVCAISCASRHSWADRHEVGIRYEDQDRLQYYVSRDVIYQNKEYEHDSSTEIEDGVASSSTEMVVKRRRVVIGRNTPGVLVAGAGRHATVDFGNGLIIRFEEGENTLGLCKPQKELLYKGVEYELEQSGYLQFVVETSDKRRETTETIKAKGREIDE